MQSGRTLFKGIQFDQVHRLQLDIETYTTPPHRFSNAGRAGDRIVIVALSDNRGWQHAIDARKLTEREMLLELVRVIRKKIRTSSRGTTFSILTSPISLRVVRSTTSLSPSGGMALRHGRLMPGLPSPIIPLSTLPRRLPGATSLTPIYSCKATMRPSVIWRATTSSM